MIPTFLVLAAMGLAATAVWPMINSTATQRPEAVIVTVTFEPTRRSGDLLRPNGQLKDEITITLQEGAKQHPKVKVLYSPWQKVLYPKKGTMVVVRAEQFTGNRLSCNITQPLARGSSDSRTGATQIQCRHTTI